MNSNDHKNDYCNTNYICSGTIIICVKCLVFYRLMNDQFCPNITKYLRNISIESNAITVIKLSTAMREIDT